MCKLYQMSQMSFTKEIFRINNVYALASLALNERLQIQSKLDLLLKTQKLLFLAKQCFFGTGDKTGRLAYHTIQNNPSIKSALIDKILSSFYSDLNSLQCPSKVRDDDNPLDKSLNYLFSQMAICQLCIPKINIFV